MGRHPFLRDNMLWISSLVAVVGLVLTIVAYSAPGATWTDPYEDVVPSQTGEGDWNLVVRVAAPIVLLIGGWYVGEQIIARRRFNRLIGTEKKSDFRRNMGTLEETARDLPHKYEDRLKEKKESFKSRR